MVRRWPWHVVGAVAAGAIAYMWLGVFWRRLPVPPLAGGSFVGSFFGMTLLSMLAGRRASPWWFVVTGVYVVTFILIALGER